MKFVPSLCNHLGVVISTKIIIKEVLKDGVIGRCDGCDRTSFYPDEVLKDEIVISADAM